MSRLEVSGQMVQEFAELSGDWSSLHTNSEFGQQSVYGRPVVQGLLPVFFALSASQLEGTLRKLVVHFLHPVFIDEPLELELQEPSSVEGGVEVSFLIRKTQSGTEATRGKFQVAEDRVPEERGLFSRSLPLEKLEEQSYYLEDLVKGHTAVQISGISASRC